MVRASLVVLLTGSACAAQTSQSYYRPSDTWVASSVVPRWYEAKPGDLYRPAWEYARTCSGYLPKVGGDYKDVKWLVVSTGALRGDSGQILLGVWLRPDTVVLDSAWIHAPWLVAHELLHHLRQPVKDEPDPHPAMPFVWPCMLMFYQSVPLQGMKGAVDSPPQRLPPLLKFIGDGVRRAEEDEP